MQSSMEGLKKLVPARLKRLLKRLVDPRLQDANRYVGTDEVSGQLQLELLKREGCKPGSKVLEIGCGNLHAGILVIQYLERGNYVGVDPNKWLREDAMKSGSVRRCVKEKRARFLSVSNFDASELGVKFDFALSHSVLSHCAHWQLGVFLRNVGKVLSPGGRILASVRLAEGNVHGSSGTPDREDSRHERWQYPGVSWFKLSTIAQAAGEVGLTVVHVPEYTEFYTRIRPKECHDWVVFSVKSDAALHA
jgi:cyclopropane fatty-acyl-phospholipid synthase-like methyltransferase